MQPSTARASPQRSPLLTCFAVVESRGSVPVVPGVCRAFAAQSCADNLLVLAHLASGAVQTGVEVALPSFRARNTLLSVMVPGLRSVIAVQGFVAPGAIDKPELARAFTRGEALPQTDNSFFLPRADL